MRENVVMAALLYSEMGWVFKAGELRRSGEFRWTPKSELYQHSGWRVCLARRLRRPWSLLKADASTVQTRAKGSPLGISVFVYSLIATGCGR